MVYKSRGANDVTLTAASKSLGGNGVNTKKSINDAFEKLKDNPFLQSQDYFERIVSTGTSMNSILIIFNVNQEQMDIICQHWYGIGMTLDKVYAIVKEKGFAEARQMFNELASEGNSAALNIVSRDLSIGDVSKSMINSGDENGGIIINVNSNMIDRD